jgi:hypothetical protein
MMLVTNGDAFSSVGAGVKEGLLVKLWGGVTRTGGCMLIADKFSWSTEGKYLASMDLLLEDDAFASRESQCDIVCSQLLPRDNFLKLSHRSDAGLPCHPVE